MSHLPPALAAAVPVVAALAVRGLALTLRSTLIHAEAVETVWRDREPTIYALWHGRLLLGPWVSARFGHRRGPRPIRVLVSHSRDGEMLARFAARFGMDVVRGSSSRGGAGALRALVSALREGDDVVIAPDGPRGPREVVQAGLATLAAISGAPVVPLAIGARPARRLSSWDALLVPAPFARCAAAVGAPVRITDDEDREHARERLQRALEATTDTADRAVARHEVPAPRSEARA